jgi:hypothetical protein
MSAEYNPGGFESQPDVSRTMMTNGTRTLGSASTSLQQMKTSFCGASTTAIFSLRIFFLYTYIQIKNIGWISFNGSGTIAYNAVARQVHGWPTPTLGSPGVVMLTLLVAGSGVLVISRIRVVSLEPAPGRS